MMIIHTRDVQGFQVRVFLASLTENQIKNRSVTCKMPEKVGALRYLVGAGNGRELKVCDPSVSFSLPSEVITHSFRKSGRAA